MTNFLMNHITSSRYEMSYNAMYDQFFPSNIGKSEEVEWDTFSSKNEEITGPITEQDPDFEVAYINAVRTQTLFSQIRDWFFAPLEFIAALPRTIVQKIILLPLYPAQSTIVGLFTNMFTRQAVAEWRVRAADQLQRNGFYFRHLVFKVHGSLYSALMAGDVNNNKWIIQATGNSMPGEHVIAYCAGTYRKLGYNVLIVNNPQVGESRGSCEPKAIKEAQEAGILFLEHVVKAKDIGVCGLSFGAAAIAPALEEHDFLSDRKYFVVRQVAFDSISNVCAKIVKTITGSKFIAAAVKRLVKWCGLEIDSTKASQVLQEKQIKEIIVQATNDAFSTTAPTKEGFISDGLIPANASLGYRLIKKRIVNSKVFVRASWLSHNDLGTILDVAAPHVD